MRNKIEGKYKKNPSRIFITLEYDNEIDETIKLNKILEDPENTNFGPFETSEEAIKFLNRDLGN